MKAITVLLVEDHSLVRAGLRSLLDEIPGIKVVAEAKNGQESLVMAAEYHPDIVLMDISMPRMNGLEAAKRLLNSESRVQVIVLSMHASEAYVVQALRIGVHGYVVKDAEPGELQTALRACMRGQVYLSPQVATHLKDWALSLTNTLRSQTEDEITGIFSNLTSRQREVLQLIAEGNTTKEIAQILDREVKTIETHRTQLMDRLDIHDVASLVRYAIRNGLINP